MLKILIALILTSTIACNGDAIKKEAAAAKARQEKYTTPPEWHEKKLVQLTVGEQTDWDNASKLVDELDKSLSAAKMHKSETGYQLLKNHNMADYPATLPGSENVGAVSIGSTNSFSITCAGSIDFLQESGHEYILYTPGGFSCYANQWISTTTGGTTYTSPDVDDRR